MNMLRKSLIALLLACAAQSGMSSDKVFAAASGSQQQEVGMDDAMASRIAKLNEQNAIAGRNVYINKEKQLIYITGQPAKKVADLEEGVTAQEADLADYLAEEAEYQRAHKAIYDAKRAAMSEREQLLEDIKMYNSEAVRWQLCAADCEQLSVADDGELSCSKAEQTEETLKDLLAKMKDAYEAVHYREKLIPNYSRAHSEFLIERIIADWSEVFSRPAGAPLKPDFVGELRGLHRTELEERQRSYAYRVLEWRATAESRDARKQLNDLYKQIESLDKEAAVEARSYIATNCTVGKRFHGVSIANEIEYLREVLSVEVPRRSAERAELLAQINELNTALGQPEFVACGDERMFDLKRKKFKLQDDMRERQKAERAEQARVCAALRGRINEFGNVPMNLDALDEAALRTLLEQKMKEAERAEREQLQELARKEEAAREKALAEQAQREEEEEEEEERRQKIAAQEAREREQAAQAEHERRKAEQEERAAQRVREKAEVDRQADVRRQQEETQRIQLLELASQSEEIDLMLACQEEIEREEAFKKRAQQEKMRRKQDMQQGDLKREKAAMEKRERSRLKRMADGAGGLVRRSVNFMRQHQLSTALAAGVTGFVLTAGAGTFLAASAAAASQVLPAAALVGAGAGYGAHCAVTTRPAGEDAGMKPVGDHHDDKQDDDRGDAV